MEITLGIVVRDFRINTNSTLGFLGVFEEIATNVVPFTVPHMTLVLSFSATLAEIGAKRPIDIELWAEDGAKVFAHSTTFTVPGARRPGSRSFFVLRFPFEGVSFPEAKRYAFRCSDVLTARPTRRWPPLALRRWG